MAAIDAAGRTPSHRERASVGAPAWAAPRAPVALLDAASRLTGELLALVSASGAVLWVSDDLTDLLGEVLPDGPCEALPVVHPDDRGVARALWIESVRGEGSGVRGEVRVRTPQGWQRLDVTVRDHLADPSVRALVFSARPVAISASADAEVVLPPRVASGGALSEPEELAVLRALVGTGRDVSCMVDAQGVLEYVTPNAEEVLGWSAAELVGRPAFDLVHPDDIDEAATRFATALAGIDTPPVRVRLVHRTEGHRVVEAIGAPLHDADGVVRGFVVNLRDLAGRLEAEAAVRASEAHLRAVVQNSYDVTAIVDSTGTVTWTTPNAAHLLGYEAAELQGRNGFDLVHPADREDLAHELARFVAGATYSTPRVVRMRREDGSWCHVEMAGTNLLDNADIAGVALTLRNVDDRVAAEQARERLIDILELSQDLVGVTDAGGHLVYWNEAASRFFGLSSVEGRPNLFRGLPAELLAWGEEHVVPALRDGDIWRGEITLRRHDGELVPHLAQLITHRDTNGQPTFFSGVLRDIGVRKAFEEQLAHQATHDPLTGLPNRTLLLDRLEHALGRTRRTGGLVALLFCDLDDFKLVNDELGHRAGDELLEAIARRLDSAVRPTDTVARFGGDEFVILCEDLEDLAMARAIATRVERALGEPFTLEGRSVQVGGSIGIALSSHHGLEPEDLLRAADTAMYRAKDRGRGRVEVAPLRPVPDPPRATPIPVRRDASDGAGS